jgi:ABC-type sugar transport system ATPase subunit
VLLNQGRIEQAAPPRVQYAQPATTFAARFLGTPAMNLLPPPDGRIAGSDVPVAGMRRVEAAPVKADAHARPVRRQAYDSPAPYPPRHTGRV